jgi:molybdopterin synthase catalytic subunit
MIVISKTPIDPGALLGEFSAGRSETGAIVSFTGLMRGEQGGAVQLELEAYAGFAQARINEVADKVAEQYALDGLLIVHRIGVMAPGDPIVFVATAAAHRRAAFEACDQLMDYLKSRAPFWKKSVGPDGARWVEPTAQDLSDAKRWD